MDAIAYRVEPGYVFPTEILKVDPEEQRWRHACCEIPHGFYGDRIDPSILATRPIKVIGHALFANYTDRGYVHTESRIQQHAPIPTGTPITFNGQFTAVDDHQRGWMMIGRFTYHDPAGNLLLEVEPKAMMADQTKMRPRPPAEASDPYSEALRPAPAVDLEPGWEMLDNRQISPAKCLGYSGNTQNIIHTDPAHAQKFGYRMPIFAGNGMVQNLIQAMQADGLQDQFNVRVRMLRPVHWDDGLAIIGRREKAGKLVEVRAVGPEGKTTNDLVVLG
jgi:acyl dehydratase